jgi:hypothetical protein
MSYWNFEIIPAKKYLTTLSIDAFDAGFFTGSIQEVPR